MKKALLSACACAALMTWSYAGQANNPADEAGMQKPSVEVNFDALNQLRTSMQGTAQPRAIQSSQQQAAPPAYVQAQPTIQPTRSQQPIRQPGKTAGLNHFPLTAPPSAFSQPATAPAQRAPSIALPPLRLPHQSGHVAPSRQAAPVATYQAPTAEQDGDWIDDTTDFFGDLFSSSTPAQTPPTAPNQPAIARQAAIAPAAQQPIKQLTPQQQPTPAPQQLAQRAPMTAPIPAIQPSVSAAPPPAAIAQAPESVSIPEPIAPPPAQIAQAAPEPRAAQPEAAAVSGNAASYDGYEIAKALIVEPEAPAEVLAAAPSPVEPRLRLEQPPQLKASAEISAPERIALPTPTAPTNDDAQEEILLAEMTDKPSYTAPKPAPVAAVKRAPEKAEPITQAAAAPKTSDKVITTARAAEPAAQASWMNTMSAKLQQEIDAAEELEQAKQKQLQLAQTNIMEDAPAELATAKTEAKKPQLLVAKKATAAAPKLDTSITDEKEMVRSLADKVAMATAADAVKKPGMQITIAEGGTPPEPKLTVKRALATEFTEDDGLKPTNTISKIAQASAAPAPSKSISIAKSPDASTSKPVTLASDETMKKAVQAATEQATKTASAATSTAEDSTKQVMQMASLPAAKTLPKTVTKPAGAGNLVVGFSGENSELPASAKAQLDAIASTLKTSSTSRVAIRGYAASADDQKVLARRIALTRGLAVRAYLIDQGVNALRINVRSMGNNEGLKTPNEVVLEVKDSNAS